MTTDATTVQRARGPRDREASRPPCDAGTRAPEDRASLRLVNALTIDVEDYFQVSAFAPYIRRDEWDSRECRVEANVDRILAMLERHGTHATFFTLGWLAERYPGLVRRIVAGGHELASHGYGHERVSDLTEVAFADDITRAKRILEDLSGTAVTGYRAPSFSIGKRNLWAFESLARAGYRYSSSIYPIVHDHYGMPDSPRFAYRVECAPRPTPASSAPRGGSSKVAEPHLLECAPRPTPASSAPRGGSSKVAEPHLLESAPRPTPASSAPRGGSSKVAEPHLLECGMLEVPITTLRLFGRNLPSSGGGYFRLLPYGLSRWMLNRVNAEDGQSAIFYFHPWEIDPGQPRIAGIDRKTRFRHYVNIGRMERRLDSLLGDFRWGRMDDIFLKQRPAAALQPAC